MALVLHGCCGPGGSTRGYVQAGHQVHGIDINPQVMEIGWTTREEPAEAIPPYFTAWVGSQLPPRGHTRRAWRNAA